MNTQLPPGAPLPQLRGLLETMSEATLSSIDEHDALFSCRLTRWEMDDLGTLWFFIDPLCVAVAHLPSLNLSFVDALGSRRISLSGQGAVYLEDLSSEYPLGAFWQGQARSACLIAQASRNNPALLKFTPQSAVYWHAQPSLVARLLALLTSMFGAKVSSVKPGMRCVELAPAWQLDAAESAR